MVIRTAAVTFLGFWQISTLLDEKLALTSEIEMLKEKLQNQDNYRIDPK